MRTVKIRNTVLGSGIPKICVPVTGRTKEEIFFQAGRAVQEKPDLLEWRADAWEYLRTEERESGSDTRKSQVGRTEDKNREKAEKSLKTAEAIAEILKGLRDILGQTPIIFTVRTRREGGMWHGSTNHYVNILLEASKCPEADLVDVELFQDIPRMRELIGRIQAEGKKVIASNHHFSETPEPEVMKTILEEMEKAGADLRKLAVMPSCPEDVLKLLQVTCQAAKEEKAPVITMSMGALGAVSRVSGQIFGSCVTFGTAGQASAPGQLEISALREILQTLRPD